MATEDRMMMDIYDENDLQDGDGGLDPTAQPSSSSTKTAATTVVVVDDGHPFDLEAYLSGYSGRSAIDRLTHIIGRSPTLAPTALKRALDLVVDPSQRDPALLQTVISAYTTASERASPSSPLPPLESLIPDQSAYAQWHESLTSRNEQDRTKLEVELKTYTNNMIKESIRLAHRDLASFHRATGSFDLALRHHTKSREFCTTPAHMLDMCLSVLELLIEHRNYAHITTYVFKAESALDAATAQAASQNSASSSGGGSGGVAGGGQSATGGGGGQSSGKRNDHFRAVEAKLAMASGLAHLHARAHSKAATKFLLTGPVSTSTTPSSSNPLAPWTGNLLHPADAGIYGTLCALATMERAEIKRRFGAGDSALGEGEGMKELVDAWLGSRFRAVIQLLDKYSTRFTLDPLLAPHVAHLTHQTRSRALTLYFAPFSTIRLSRMADAFGWTLPDTEREVVALIRSGSIRGRVDSQNKVLRARQVDPRAQLYDRAVRSGAEMEKATAKLLLRLRLQQTDLVVRKTASTVAASAAAAGGGSATTAAAAAAPPTPTAATASVPSPDVSPASA